MAALGASADVGERHAVVCRIEDQIILIERLMMSVDQWSRRGFLRGVAGIGFIGAALGVEGIAPASALASEELRIALLGDSMIDGIWGGLLRAVQKESCLQGGVKLGRYGMIGTGLTRADKFDWTADAKKILVSFQPELVIVSLGLNDRQAIVSPTKERTEFNTPEWRARYSEATTAFIKSAGAAPAGLLWIGLPSMRDAAAQADAEEKNRIFSEAVQAAHDPRIEFIEPWRMNGSADEAFQAYGPDASGTRIQIRAGDGIHFTSAGYDMVAAYLLPKIVAHLQANKIDIAYPCPRG
jgi:hypothetical protein